MDDMQVILLDDCRRDRFLLLSHLYQLWCTPQLRTSWLQVEPTEPEDFNGYNIPPGMEEIPFCLMLAEAPIRSLALETDDIYITAHVPSGRIEAVCDTPKSVAVAEILQEAVLMFSGARTHALPQLAEQKPGYRLDEERPFVTLYNRALKLPMFKNGLMVAVNGERTFTRSHQPLQQVRYGIFYGFDLATRSFISYDTFSDRLVCYGPVKSVLSGN